MGAHGFRVFFVGLLLAAYAVPAQAQYFGRNKVRYDQADIQILHTTHFDIYFYKESLESAQHRADLALYEAKRLGRRRAVPARLDGDGSTVYGSSRPLGLMPSS